MSITDWTVADSNAFDLPLQFTHTIEIFMICYNAFNFHNVKSETEYSVRNNARAFYPSGFEWIVKHKL